MKLLLTIRHKLLLACVHWPRLCGLLFLIHPGFRSEQRAVVASLLSKQHVSAERLQDWNQLRQYTHILEKGLCHKNRRSLFGKRYVLLAVQMYKRLCQEPEDTAGRKDLLQWSGDVLEKYFDVVGDGDPDIDNARQLFGMAGRSTSCGETMTPYFRDLNSMTISFNDLLQLAKRRRSVRWYKADPVPRELLDRAILIAGLSPSACNKQPFHFRICDDPELVPKVCAIPGGVSSFSNSVPCIAVITGDLRSWPEFSNRHTIYVDACLAAMSFQYALEVQRLSSCCIHWTENENHEKELAGLLGMPVYERAVMLITIGWPDPEGMVPRSMKKSISQLRSYNKTEPVF